MSVRWWRPAEAVRPVDSVDGGIGTVAGDRKIRSPSDDGKDAAAGGHHRAIVGASGAGVEDENIVRLPVQSQDRDAIVH